VEGKDGTCDERKKIYLMGDSKKSHMRVFTLMFAHKGTYRIKTRFLYYKEMMMYTIHQISPHRHKNIVFRGSLIILVIFMAISAVVLPAVAEGTRESSAAQEVRERPDYGNPAALAALIEDEEEPCLLIDVRTPEEYRGGYIPTAINIPVQDLPDGLPEVEKDFLVILYCRSGNRSATAVAIFREAGFINVVDFGGIYRWPEPLDRP